MLQELDVQYLLDYHLIKKSGCHWPLILTLEFFHLLLFLTQMCWTFITGIDKVGS